MDARTIIRSTAPVWGPEPLPVHPVTGLRAIGVLSRGPVWPVLGGSGEDDDAGGDDAGDGDGDDDTEGDDDGDDSGDESKAKDGKAKGKQDDEGDADDKVSRAELLRAIRERDRAKKLLRESRKENTDLKQAGEGAEEKATREAREVALAEADKRYKPLIIQKSARAELIEAGLKPDKVARFTKLLDLDEIEVEDDGTVTGLSEQVEELKEEWPELFTDPAEEDRKTRRTSGSRAADGADKGKGGQRKELSVTERQAASLLGKRG